LNAIPATLFNLALSKADSITLFTSNYYTSSDHHAIGYRQKNKNKNRFHASKNLRTVLANHDLITQKKESYLLWRIGVSNLQLATAKIISLKNDEYLKMVATSILVHANSINSAITVEKPLNKDPHLDSYSNFINCESTLNSDKLNLINNKIDKEIAKGGLNLSFMNLADFRRYIGGKTIALVANSAQLLKQNLGETIDGYDIVIRFNSFKLDQKHTGNKTNVHVSVYLQKENLNEFVPIRFILSNHLGRWIDTLKESRLYAQSFFLKYNHHTSIGTSYKDKTPPTSGFSTLTLLLKLGGFKRIDLFGFTFYEGGESSILRNENGTKEGISKIHNYNFEKDAIFANSHEYDKKNNIFTFFDPNLGMDGLKC
jgi:hypothetical protein